jgi:hypothetical protein
MIDGGMRSGIPDKAVRERTITIYTNKALFKKKLKIHSEDTIYLYLMDKKGKVIWHVEGKFDNNKLKTLENFLLKYK